MKRHETIENDRGDAKLSFEMTFLLSSLLKLPDEFCRINCNKCPSSGQNETEQLHCQLVFSFFAEDIFETFALQCCKLIKVIVMCDKYKPPREIKGNLLLVM